MVALPSKDHLSCSKFMHGGRLGKWNIMLLPILVCKMFLELLFRLLEQSDFSPVSLRLR